MEKESEKSNRRRFVLKLASLGAALSLAGLVGSQDNGRDAPIPLVQAASGNALLINESNVGDTGTTSLTSSTSGGDTFYVENDGPGGTAIHGYQYNAAGYGYGVFGSSLSPYGVGVTGQNMSTPYTPTYGVTGVVAGFTKGSIGVAGFATNKTGQTYGVTGSSSSSQGVGVLGSAGDPGGIPIVAQAANGGRFQEWLDYAGNVVSVIDKYGQLGIGTGSPARSVHLISGNACFRMDRNVNSSAFILTRTDPYFSTIWKTFYVGVDASGSDDGYFFVGDVGTNVAGPSTVRMLIDNAGNVGFNSTPSSTPNAIESLFAGGAGMVGIANATTAPGTPSGGGVLYVQSGALYYKGSGGTVTKIANA